MLGKFEKWRSDADALIRKIESGQSESGKAIDDFTHAALIDSMLRNWALPVGDMQTAFDHWRVNRRDDIWKLINKEVDNLGIDMRALSGENIRVVPSVKSMILNYF